MAMSHKDTEKNMKEHKDAHERCIEFDRLRCEDARLRQIIEKLEKDFHSRDEFIIELQNKEVAY